jgi:UPF0755 protein
MRRILSLVLVVLLLAGTAAATFWYQYRQFLQTPLSIENAGMIVMVESGSSIRSVLTILESQGVTNLDWRWRLLNRLRQGTIKTGEYELKPGMLPVGLLDLLASGKVVSYRFTIVEGWTVKQLLAELGRNPVLKQNIQDLVDLNELEGLPAGNPEGWFLPETYAFVRGDSDLQILRRAYKDMQVSLEEVWAGRDTGLPYETPYELMIMASIIERETSMEIERAEVAGVFVRRLLQRWRLETDPTVIYGMGDAYQGNIRRQDLKTDTPYNTYTRHGLPPGPIALAGLASLQAAAHPANGEAMFFVADGQGGHTFSITLEAHNRAVKELIKQSKRKPVKTGKGE